ncbi:MAG TPA: aromatic ring-hydroxylating dioxygenase subunit alpha [Candidatus Limnocylindrales bacterium]|nr:aromatic ring-hydroxylating dioxygenase subunit alpha [Candidatus Limnocylindrales bacterium]
MTPPPLTDEELAAVRRPFREASLLPGRAYHDESIWAFEREQWFYRDWICVGREEDAATPGSYFLATLVDEPLVVVRGRDGHLRGFYNVCRHRGTAVLEEQRGKVVRFQCPYHAWIYDLEGRLVRAKHMDDVEGFSPDTFGLAPVRVGTWGGFVFISLADAGPTLEAYLGDWVEHHEAFGRDFSPLRRAARLTYDVAANWKIVAENYSECYHCPGVHPLLNRLTPYDLGDDFEPTGPWKGGWMPLAAGCETMSMDGLRHGRPLIAGTDGEASGRIHYYILWPNLIVSVHPDYVLTHQTWPNGPERSTVWCDLYLEADAVAAGVDVSGAVEFWDLTNRQDYHVVELQQVGTRSRSFAAGRFSNQEASVHAFDIMVADRYANDGARTSREQRTRAGSVTRVRRG